MFLWPTPFSYFQDLDEVTSSLFAMIEISFTLSSSSSRLRLFFVPFRMRKILLAVDGSQTSNEMVEWASEHLLQPNDQVLAVHVRERPNPMFALDNMPHMTYSEEELSVRCAFTFVVFLHQIFVFCLCTHECCR